MTDDRSQDRPAGALAGIVVADFSRVLAAPYATMLFGDLGADVIKIERPGLGDDTRQWGPPFTDDHEATYFLSVNRNKRSFSADMSDPADHDDLVELIRRADVLIENFRPGTMARHGLSYDQVAAINPRLVYCSITGFGSDGAAAALPGYDLLVQAVGGLMSVTGDRRAFTGSFRWSASGLASHRAALNPMSAPTRSAPGLHFNSAAESSSSRKERSALGSMSPTISGSCRIRVDTSSLPRVVPRCSRPTSRRTSGRTMASSRLEFPTSLPVSARCTHGARL